MVEFVKSIYEINKQKMYIINLSYVLIEVYNSSGMLQYIIN